MKFAMCKALDNENLNYMETTMNKKWNQPFPTLIWNDSNTETYKIKYLQYEFSSIMRYTHRNEFLSYGKLNGTCEHQKQPICLEQPTFRLPPQYRGSFLDKNQKPISLCTCKVSQFGLNIMETPMNFKVTNSRRNL